MIKKIYVDIYNDSISVASNSDPIGTIIPFNTVTASDKKIKNKCHKMLKTWIKDNECSLNNNNVKINYKVYDANLLPKH